MPEARESKCSSLETETAIETAQRTAVELAAEEARAHFDPSFELGLAGAGENRPLPPSPRGWTG